VRTATARIVEAHLNWVRVKGLSPKTVHNRAGVLTRLDRFLEGRDLLKATPDELEAFLGMPSKNQASRAVDGSHLKQFFKWATAKGHVKRDPTVLLPVPRKPRRLPRPLSLEDAATAIALADPEMRIILGLACMCGLRADEIARLRGTDVLWDHDPPLLHVRGKGDKDRRVPVPPQLAEWLGDWYRSGPLIRYRAPGRQHDHMPAYMISSRANQYLHKLGMSAVHSLRHTAGSWFYRESGRDLRLTQEFLGHASPVSTAIYTKIDPDEMSAISRRLELPLPTTTRENTP
jgi:integrase/recombinase XerC